MNVKAEGRKWMGYDLTIGEAYLEYDKSNNYLRVCAKTESHINAPAYGEPTDNSNQRWPSYTAWADFLRFVGLYDSLWNKDSETCLKKTHPGFAAIGSEHKELIDAAYKSFYKKYPNCKPGFSPKSTDFEDDPQWPVENTWAVRLEWLKYWVDWSLENCKIPILENS